MSAKLWGGHTRVPTWSTLGVPRHLPEYEQAIRLDTRPSGYPGVYSLRTVSDEFGSWIFSVVVGGECSNDEMYVSCCYGNKTRRYFFRQ